MKALPFFLLFLSAQVFSQQGIEEAIINHLLRYHHPQSYESISFSEVDTIFDISAEGQELIDSVLNSELTQLSNYLLDSTENKPHLPIETETITSKIKSKQQEFRHYAIEHRYKALNRNEELYIYSALYKLDKDFKILGSRVTREKNALENGS